MNTLLSRCRHCLVVDDSPHMIEIVRAMLEAFGLRFIIGQHDAKVAFDYLMKNKVDLLIIDYNMGTANGIQFVARVRNLPDPAKAQIPIVMMTSHTEQTRMLAARDAGVDACVRKPVTGRELYEKIAFAVTRTGRGDDTPSVRVLL